MSQVSAGMNLDHEWLALQEELDGLEASTGTALSGQDSVEFAYAALRGARPYMEDYVRADTISNTREDIGCFSVFDGHGGQRVSDFCANEICSVLEKTFEQNEGMLLGDALIHSYCALDEELEKDVERRCIPRSILCYRETNVNEFTGSTGVTVLVTSTQITFANVGDSRALLHKQGRIEFETEDHTPELFAERARATAAGGLVSNGRLVSSSLRSDSYGIQYLSVSRAFGDFAFKKRRSLAKDRQEVISVPDVHTVDRSGQDEFLVVASDGVWAVMTSYMVAKFVSDRIIEGDMTTERCCTELIAECIGQKRSTDNISLIIVKLNTT